MESIQGFLRSTIGFLCGGEDFGNFQMCNLMNS